MPTILGSPARPLLAMVLALDLVPADLRSLYASRLVAAIDAAGGALATGIHGTRFLLPALCDTGHVDVAYAVLSRRDYPSWQYSIDQGATTIWERWDESTLEHGLQTPTLNSMNHPALGSVAEWMHAYVAGLRPADDRLEIRPYPGGGMSSVSSTTTVRGSLAGSTWRIDGSEIELRCTVPPGVEAVVRAPTGSQAGPHRGWERYVAGPGEWTFLAPWDVSWRPGDVGPGLLVRHRSLIGCAGRQPPSAFQVFGPQMPSGASWHPACKRVSAPCVPWPNTPSRLAGLSAITPLALVSSACISVTSAPR